MVGASLGTSDMPPSLLEEVSGAWEMRPSPCNQGCTPLECTIKLPKEMTIFIRYEEELKH